MSAAQGSTWPILTIDGAPQDGVLEDIIGLARAAEDADGNPPLSEQTLVNLRAARQHPGGLLVLATYASDGGTDDDEELAGVAVVSFPRADGEPGVLELVVRPTYRNQGVGASLVQALKEHRLPELRAWSHGNHAAAVELAAHAGFTPVRELWRMRQTRAALEAAVPDVVVPAGVRLRTFEPGTDERAWLEANAAAFAHHPEQGSTTLEDLQARMAEDWFDPAGLILAIRESDDRLLGFHWTKVHPRSGKHPAIGEVYVVGVTPEAQGMGLGKALTIAGIEHLHSLGLQAIMLYVDADNTAAIALYRSLGFTRWDVDVMYAPGIAGGNL
ncbi:mycothiol synthase [Arthrobacter pigmenti]|uniref:Mycothiol acetyltransferase n=1 Tax=Arthrobacter pigmenti TaxID=271432 RepID=A0A846RRK6_9MICC|nr:mycothiol synthase [Arthrobacter pigmenti]NJC23202.1 mycothiol synthase [Arthrobacter pigmenti]